MSKTKLSWNYYFNTLKKEINLFKIRRSKFFDIKDKKEMGRKFPGWLVGPSL